MAALTKDRNTISKAAGRLATLPVAAATTLFKGSIIMVNAAGFAIPGADTASVIVAGIAQHAVDNSAGGAGDENVVVERGATVELETSGTVVDQADAMGPVYLADDQTVEKIGGVSNNIIAGVLEQFDPESGKPIVKMTDPTV